MFFNLNIYLVSYNGGHIFLYVFHLTLQGLRNRTMNTRLAVPATEAPARPRGPKQAAEKNFSLILLCIVAVFLTCHLPRNLLNIAEFAAHLVR